MTLFQLTFGRMMTTAHPQNDNANSGTDAHCHAARQEIKEIQQDNGKELIAEALEVGGLTETPPPPSY